MRSHRDDRRRKERQTCGRKDREEWRRDEGMKDRDMGRKKERSEKRQT